MKKIILSILVITGTLSAYTQNLNLQEDANMCKIFTKKASDYKNDMRKDDYSKKTLDYYEKRISLHCNNLK
jgi:hypothetical protein